MTRLIEAAAELSRARGRDFLALYPAQEELFAYYAKHGFATLFYRKEMTLKRGVLAVIADKLSVFRAPEAVTSEEIFALRETLFIRSDGLSWNADAIAYACGEFDKLIAVADASSLCAYAFADESDNLCIIEECIAKPGTFPALAAEILRASQAESFRFILSPDFPLSSDSFKLCPAGMLRPLTERGENAAYNLRNAYLGLPLN
jgi:hypothetical protein